MRYWTLLAIGTVIVAGRVDAAPTDNGKFLICEDQTYALCAAASCFVFNQVAYCKCDVETGNSITLPLTFDGGNACTVDAQGVDNGYMVSTYSLPASVVAGGNQAIYTCAGRNSDGAYAQCDGGICFTSTQGQTFPGFTQPLTDSEIICSCPITTDSPSRGFGSYQIVGPFPCQNDFFDYCDNATANTNTGSTIYVGAPTGTPRLLTRLLDGSVPKLNRCLPPK